MVEVRAGAEADTSPRLALVVTVIMAKSIPVTKKSRGRPKTTGIGVQIGMRWQEPDLEMIDDWIQRQKEPCTRPEAIRRLVELGLKAKK
jgi:hypothetical protein